LAAINYQGVSPVDQDLEHGPDLEYERDGVRHIADFKTKADREPTFVGWLYANDHTPSAWQLEVARKVDAGTGGFPTLVGGARFGKTWLYDRWAEYVEEQAQVAARQRDQYEGH
jgi:hypothetical protein